MVRILQVILSIVILMMTGVAGSKLGEGGATRECDALEVLCLVSGFTPATYGQYCAFNCNFNSEIKCDSGLYSGDDSVVLAKVLMSFIRPVIDLVESRQYEGLDQANFIIDVDVDLLYDLVGFFMPLLFLTIICLIAVNIKSRSTVIVLAVLSVVYVLFTCSLRVTIPYLFLVTAICLVDPKQLAIQFIAEFSLLMIVTACASYFSMSDGMDILYVLVAVAFIAYSGYRFSRSKNSGDVMMLFYFVAIIVMCSPMLQNVIARRAKKSLFSMTIMFLANITIPIGPYRIFVLNIWYNLAKFVDYLDKRGIILTDNQVFGILVASCLIFLIFRTMVGWYAVYHSRIKFDVRSLGVGLFVYAVDSVYAPLHLVSAIFGGASGRAVAYYLTITVLNYIEWCYAYDILIIRVFIAIIDVIVIHSGVDKFSRYLNIDIDLSGISFPKLGSFPGSSISQLKDILANVVSIENMGRRGVGFIRRDPVRGVKFVHTVNHVVADTDDVKVNGHVQSVREYNKLGGSEDPAVVFKYTGGVEGSAVSVLSPTEVNDVNHLYLASGGGVITPIIEFKFENRGGDIQTTVNVMQGDSGSPVFAVLKNGSIRLCGAVSRGTLSEGVGNLVSSLVQFRHGSPGYEGSYFTRQVKDFTMVKLYDNVNLLMEEGVTFLKKDGDVETPAKRTARKKKRSAVRARLESLINVVGDPVITADVLQAFDDGNSIKYNAVRGTRYIPGSGSGLGWT